MSEFKNLTLDVADQIAVLAISRPAALNALNSETLDELNVCLSEIEANDDIKAVILTGGPDKKGNEFKSFVAGADIAEMVNFTAPEARAFGIKASEPFFKLMSNGIHFLISTTRTKTAFMLLPIQNYMIEILLKMLFRKHFPELHLNQKHFFSQP